MAVHERLRDSSGGCANGGPILVEIRREDERDLLGFGLNRYELSNFCVKSALHIPFNCALTITNQNM